MHDFTSMTEVINHVEAVTILDLMDSITTLDEKFMVALIEPPAGLYVHGSIEPFIDFSKKYYLRSDFGNENKFIQTAVQGIDNDYRATLASHKQDILTERGDVAVSYRDLVTKAKFISAEPSVPVTALKAAIAVVEQSLTSFCWHSKRSHPQYRLEYLVKPQYRDFIVNDEIVDAFTPIQKKLMDFIGDDQMHIYFTKVKGTNMVIEKAIDWRIYKYYEMTFKSQEEHQE